MKCNDNSQVLLHIYTNSLQLSYYLEHLTCGEFDPELRLGHMGITNLGIVLTYLMLNVTQVAPATRNTTGGK